MYFDREIRDVIYIDKNLYIKILVSFLCAYLFITILTLQISFKSGNSFDIIIKIFYLIASFCMILLTYSTANISESKIFYYLSINFLVIAMLSLNLSSMTSIILISNISDIKLTEMCLKTFTLSFSNALVYRYLDKDNFNLKKIILKGAILYLLFFIFLKLNLEILNSISVGIIIILIAFKNGQIMRKDKLILDGKINFLYVYAILNFIIYFLCVIGYKYRDNIFIYRTIDFIFFVSFSITVFSTIYKMINTPYLILFRDLYESNENLNKINSDIKRKNNELEFSQNCIRKKELMFNELFKNIPVPIIILSEATLRIIYCNASFLKLLKEKNIKSVINKKISNLINLEKEIEIKDGNLDNKIYRGSIEKGEYKKYLNLEIIDINKESGEYILSVNDITTMIKFNSIKEDIERKVIQENLKRDFLSNISHDLKTPINVIYSALQLEHIFVERKDRQALLKYNLISKKNCFSLIKLTNNLIDSSRIQSDYLYPNLERLNVVEFIEDAVTSLIGYTKQKEINLIFDTNNEEIYLKIDQSFMERILLNLISNAIKFTPKNGEITVGVFEKEDLINVIVKDSGVGMDENILNKVFSRYAMGSNNRDISEKGSGIGLFVVKKLVELQEGTIDVYSKKGEGTKIILTFKKEGD